MEYIAPTKKTFQDSKAAIIISDHHLYGMKTMGAYCDIYYKGEFLIDLQIRELEKHHPKIEIFLVTGYDSHNIIGKNKRLKYIENVRYNYTGQSESARLGLNACNHDKVFVIIGNTVFNAKHLNKMSETSSISVRKDSSQKYVGVNRDKKNMAREMSFRESNCWNGIVYLENDILDRFKVKLKDLPETYELYEGINEIVSELKVVQDDSVFNINQIGDLSK